MYKNVSLWTDKNNRKWFSYVNLLSQKISLLTLMINDINNAYKR